MTGISEPGASRDGYGDALLDLSSDKRVVVLEADLGKSTKSCHFRAQYPDRTFCLGIWHLSERVVEKPARSPSRVLSRYSPNEPLSSLETV